VGIRETLNENRSVTVGATIGITIVAIAWIVWYCITGGQIQSSPAPAAPTTQSVR
jgi:hypothetical protein